MQQKEEKIDSITQETRVYHGLTYLQSIIPAHKIMIVSGYLAGPTQLIEKQEREA